ncbi:MAG: DUF6261 family protein [Paludibacteraceae bacterium]
MKLFNLSLSKLRNMELANFTFNVIQIIEKNDPDQLKLTEPYRLLKNSEPLIFTLVSNEKATSKTADYGDNRKERKNCVLGLKNEAKSIYQINAEDKRKSIRVLYPVIKASFTNFYSKNLVEQNEIVHQFLHLIDTTPTLTEAIVALGMQSGIEHLREIQSTFNVKYETFRKVRSQYVKKNSNVIKKELRTQLSDFFASLYLAKKHNKELDYTKLENELSTEMQRVRLIILERESTTTKTKPSTEM